jgi:hypothetical protein
MLPEIARAIRPIEESKRGIDPVARNELAISPTCTPKATVAMKNTRSWEGLKFITGPFLDLAICS